MIELIAIIASLILCITTLIEVAKIRKGWVRPKFGDDRQGFIAAYQRQLNYLTWLGLIFGVLLVGTAFLIAEPGEDLVKLVAAASWFAVAGICFVSRRRLPPGAQPGKLSATHA